MSRTQVQDQRLDDLESERDFLLRSIEDLEEERRAGDVSDDDYSRLIDSYTTRAAEVLRSIEAIRAVPDAVQSDASTPDTSAERESEDAGDPADPKPASGQKPLKKKRILLIGGIVSILAGATFAYVASNTSDRLPGNTATGGVSLPLGQQEQRELDQAAVLEQEGEISQALNLYEEVLSQDPGNPLALSEAGWLEFEAGVVGKSQKSLEQGAADEVSAVALDPRLASARAYLGSIFLIEGQPAKAVIQYRQFIADGASASQIAPFVTDMRLAYEGAKQPLPSQIKPAAKK